MLAVARLQLRHAWEQIRTRDPWYAEFGTGWVAVIFGVASLTFRPLGHMPPMLYLVWQFEKLHAPNPWLIVRLLALAIGVGQIVALLTDAVRLRLVMMCAMGWLLTGMMLGLWVSNEPGFSFPLVALVVDLIALWRLRRVA